MMGCAGHGKTPPAFGNLHYLIQVDTVSDRDKHYLPVPFFFFFLFAGILRSPTYEKLSSVQSIGVRGGKPEFLSGVPSGKRGEPLIIFHFD